MPNKTTRYKRGGASAGRSYVRNGRKNSDSVKTLLSGKGSVALARVSAQAARQKEWRQWLEEKLPAATVARLSGVVERGDTLVVFTESAAWSARVRFAVLEIEPLIKKEWPGIREVLVRVMPRA